MRAGRGGSGNETSTNLRIKWNGQNTEPFYASCVVGKGRVPSPILFTLYLDDSLSEISHTNVGCFWDIFATAIAHVMLLVPTPFALKKLLAIAMRDIWLES